MNRDTVGWGARCSQGTREAWVSYLIRIYPVIHNISTSRWDIVHKLDLLLRNNVQARAKDFWKKRVR